MSGITIVWSMVASACLTVAALHLYIGVRRRSRSDLLFAASAVCAAVIAFLEMSMMLSPSPQRHGEVIRLFHVPFALLVLTLVLFVRSFLDAGRAWLGGLAVAIRFVMLAVDELVAPNVNFRSIDRVVSVPLPWGESMHVAHGALRGWTRLGQLGSVIFVVFVLDAIRTAWRRGRRRQAAVVGGSVAFAVGVGAAHTALLMEGTVRSPTLISVAYLAVVAAMSWELTSEALRAGELSLETARQREQLAHLSRVALLGELSGSLAHELKQPLTAILSNAQAAQRFLAEGGDRLDEVRQILADIASEDKRAGEVIQRLRVLFQKGQAQVQPIDLAEVAGEALALARSDLVLHGVAAKAELPPNLPAAMGDRIQIQQVILNLVANACEAMDSAGGSERRIVLRASRADGAGLELSVSDSGAGLPEGAETKLFEPFFTTKSDGVGLGLSVCRTIIDAHGGRLWATRNPEGGATLHFTLPTAGGAT